MTSSEILIVLILSSAGLIRGAFGFGDALFAMPLLLLLTPIRSAGPMMAIVALMIAIVILIREWRDIEWRPAAALILSGMVGIPIGIWVMSILSESFVKGALGCLLLVFSSWSLWKPNALQIRSDSWAPLFGVAAGMLGGAYNTAGPPLVIYATLRSWKPQVFRAMMQAYCLAGSTWIITTHAAFGNITRRTLFLTGAAAPLVVLFTLLGQRLTSHMPAETFARVIHRLLLILGGFLVWTAFADSIAAKATLFE